MEFDRLLLEYENKTRTITKRERYPKGIQFSRELLELLEAEYLRQYLEVNNRKFHSNFMKGLSFKMDEIKRIVEEKAKDIKAEQELENQSGEEAPE